MVDDTGEDKLVFSNSYQQKQYGRRIARIEQKRLLAIEKAEAERDLQLAEVDRICDENPDALRHVGIWKVESDHKFKIGHIEKEAEQRRKQAQDFFERAIEFDRDR